MQMAKDAQAEMITIGLKDEGGMVDEASGNEVPNGALKEEVRDDQPAMLSPGEFVIPAYAVRYIGVERLVGILREAKQGMEQLDDIGLTGEPNSDDAGLETAVLPSEMQNGIPMLAEGGDPGAVVKTALPTQAQQTVFPTTPAAAAAPSPVVQAATRTVPIRPTDKTYTYPQLQYNPMDKGAGTGYGVEEYVGPQGQSIFVTTIGGKPLSKVPEGYVTRAKYNKKQTTTPTTPTTPTELKLKPEDPGSFEAPEGDDGSDGRVVTPASLEAAVAALSNAQNATASQLATIAGVLNVPGAAAVGALSNIFGFGAKANVVSILSQLGVIDGARKVDEDGKKGARYTSQELIDLATKPDEFGRTLSNKIDLEDRTSDKSSKLALGPKEQAKEKAYQTQRNTMVEAAKTMQQRAEDEEQDQAAEGGFAAPNKGGAANAAALGGIGAAAAAAAAAASQGQSTTAVAPTNVGYPGSGLGSRSTAQNIAADTNIYGPDTTSPDPYSGPAPAAPAGPSTGASGGQGGMGGGMGMGGSGSSLISVAGQGTPGTAGVSDPSFSAPDAPDFSISDATGYSGTETDSFTPFAEGGLITVGDKTYGPEDFGFANKGAFVTKKKTRKRKRKQPRGKGLASKYK